MATSTGAPDEFTRHTLIHLFGQARLDEANALAEQMIGSHPKHSLAWKVKGAIQLRLGDFLGAIKTIQKAIALAPKDWELFNSLGLAFKGMGKLSNAQAAYQQAISLNPQYPNVYVNLGALLRESGKLDQALKCYRKKLELTPDDEEAHFHAAALSGEQLPTAPGIYVKNLFDQYAQRFDQHLTGALKYETPKHLAELFFHHHTLPAHSTVLDLGCGTGLVAQAFEPDPSATSHAHWIGVDLSPQMIEQARAKNRYHELLCTDLRTALQAQADHSVDLAVAADVFIYVGDLALVFQELARVLKPTGSVLFSIETRELAHLPKAQESVGFSLLPSGRYAHDLSYIEALATQHNLCIQQIEACTIRQENGQPIRGHLISLIHK